MICKVLFLTNTFPSLDRRNNGAFNFRAAKQLSRNVNIKIIHLRAWNPKRRFLDFYKIDELEVTVFSFPLFVNLGPKLYGIQLFIYKRIFLLLYKRKLKKIDVIHSVGASFSGVVGSYVSQKLDIKHVAQCIGSDINFTIPLLTNYFGIKNWSNYVNCFGCNSNELATAVKNLYPEAITEVIYRGVDLEEFNFNQNKFLQSLDKISILFLGGLSYRGEASFGRNLKGGVSVLEAWKTLLDKNPEYKDKVELLFGGPEVSRQLIVNKLKVENINLYSLKIIGQIDKDQVNEFMQKSQIVLVPSMAEGMPNIAMEAAASGCVVIASDVGGTHEVVVDTYNGILIQAGNVHQLSEAIKTLIKNKNELKNMGEKGRNLMEERFDSKQFSKNYLSLYNSLLNKS